ncbi:Folylpolyglutamate synthase mitochondrial [Taenia crassiceps]|uniref:tetrahydrofolate synthase n=1 Tax=Taenia crassiceps TaxID=6207 RepID=A0ABR4Q0L8_9CEST
MQIVRDWQLSGLFAFVKSEMSPQSALAVRPLVIFKPVVDGYVGCQFGRPRVTVVTAIELEHTDILGDTIQKVAWNKAGIFKPGVPAVVARDEPEDAMAVFVEEAKAVQVVSLFVAPRFGDVQGGLGGADVVSADWRRLVDRFRGVVAHERNVCVALAAVSLWHGHHNVVSSSVALDASLRAGGVPTLALCPTGEQVAGIASTRVVGRFHEVRMSERLTFFVDCAHTAESIEHCSNWFQTASPAPSSDAGRRGLRILLFTVTGTRNPLVMLRRLETLCFDVVYFAGFIAGNLARVGPKLPCPRDCKAVWEELAPSTPSYELVDDQLVEFLRTLKTWDGVSALPLSLGAVQPRRIHVLVTGSAYLVGDVLSTLWPEYRITWT